MCLCVRQGLSEAETRALLEPFRSEFFEEPGVRLISILPCWVYDALLPLHVASRPAEVVRVGLVVTECNFALQESGFQARRVSDSIEPATIMEQPR